MKKFKKLVSGIMVLAIGASVALTGCGGGGGNADISLPGSNESGSMGRPGGKETVVTFWGYGDEYETEVFENLVEEFNEMYNGYIEVDYVPKASSSYGNALSLQLGSPKCPDVFYVGDGDYKEFATQGYLLDISDYVANSTEYKLEDMWGNVKERYYYDVETTLCGEAAGDTGAYYGVPKDIGPIVIYYNETMFNESGVKVISVPVDQLDAFNNENGADRRGKTKTDYQLPANFKVQEKGYFVDTNGQKWFNNAIAMSWEECYTLSMVIQEKYDPQGTKGIYGFFTEWWFNYGWGVGGNCIQYIESDDPQYSGGYYDFSLADPTKNFIVADGQEPFVINGTTYQVGETISYQDKLTNEEQVAGGNYNLAQYDAAVTAAVASGQLWELPSQKEAFEEFVRLAAHTNVTIGGKKGYAITANPQSLGGDSGKTSAFSSGKTAMLVDGRWNVCNFRDIMGKNDSDPNLVYKWDVAPLVQYREYNEDGSTKVRGKMGGHSGSVALSISKQCKVPNAAWKFIEFIGGETGQAAQAKQGFAIPLQKEIAYSEVFLQSDRYPYNAEAFCEAADYEIAGDWWFLLNNDWIDDWAGVLNGEVRNGKRTIEQFYTCNEFTKTYDMLKAYTKADR